MILFMFSNQHIIFLLTLFKPLSPAPQSFVLEEKGTGNETILFILIISHPDVTHRF